MNNTKVFLIWIAAISSFISIFCSSFLLFVEENINLKTGNILISITRMLSIIGLVGIMMYITFSKKNTMYKWLIILIVFIISVLSVLMTFSIQKAAV